MANNYKVKVQVEIEECAATTADGPRKEDVGVFEWVVSAEQAHSIDECEQIVLQTGCDALRDAFAHHLSSVSREYALGIVGSLDECEVKPYRVDGEIGRITFDIYWNEQMEDKGHDTAGTPFPALHAKEWYRTTGFKEIALVYGTTEESYRKASELINRVRRQEEATPSRTLRENTEYEGREVMARMEKQAVEIFHEHGFTTEGTPTEAAEDRSEQVLITLPAQEVEQAIQACAPEPEWVAEMTDNPVPYEDPDRSAQVSLDDVNVKRQKATRRDAPELVQKRKYVHNTIAHIAHAGASYVISGHGIVHVLRLVLAFLLHNHLLQDNLMFFADGQRTLYAAILRAFAWLSSVQIILD